MADYTITLIKGDTYNGKEFVITRNGAGVSITSARMQVKRKAKDTAHVLQLTSGSGLTIGASSITIDKQIVDITAGEYVYDLELTLTGGEVKTWIAGDFIVLQDVTE